MLIRSQNHFCRHGRGISTRTPQIFPLPQNLNSILTSWDFRLQGRGFWMFFMEGPEKFFERSVPMGQKSFWEVPSKTARFIDPAA